MKTVRILWMMTALAAGLSVDANADIQATIMMRSGERVAGNLEALDGGTLFIRNSSNDQQRLPFDQVAVIDLVGGAQGLPETELKEARGADHLLLERSGSSLKGRLVDIDGGRGTAEGVAAKLTFIFRTQGGEERRFATEQLARVYLGNYPGPAPSGTATAETVPAPVPVAGAVSVSATRRWVDSGIIVLSGQLVTFEASGEVRLSQDGQDTATPAGSKQGRRAPGSPMPGALAGALIGRVGNSQPFGIGDQSRPLGMPADGRLYLSVNDDEMGDNSGAFQVRVTPGPRPASRGSR